MRLASLVASFSRCLFLSSSQRENAEKCVYYHQKRLELHLDSPNIELTYASARWLPYAYFFILRDEGMAEQWYKVCIEVDPERVDCPVELSKLYTWTKRHKEAYELALLQVNSPFPDRGEAAASAATAMLETAARLATSTLRTEVTASGADVPRTRSLSSSLRSSRPS